MVINILGSGNVATHLAPALERAGHSIVGVWSRTDAHARELCHRLNGAVATDDMTMLPEADVYVISVKDDALEVVAQLLAEALRKACNGIEPLVLHTAGTMPMDVLKPWHRHCGVLYPMQTFSKQKAVDFSVIPFFVEGMDDGALQTAREIAESLTERVYSLTSQERRHLHLAAVWACNFANHCYSLAEEELQKVGLPFDVLLPLIDETTSKIHTIAPRDAQTGPARRWDENVMQMQMDMIDDDRQREIYRLMSESIHG